MTKDINYDTITNEEISRGTFKLLVGRDYSLDYVAKNSDKLDVLHEHVYKSFGFENFFDCFLYVTNEPERVEKGGDKNLSRLNKVKRKVVRNGKEMEMTVYEDGNKEEDKDKKDGTKEVSRNASGSRVISNGEEGKVNPKRVANSLSSLGSKGADTSHVNTNASVYKEYVDEEGEPIGITSFRATENDIILDSYASTPDSSGVGLRSIMELIKLSIKQNKNAIVYDIDLPEAIEFLKSLGFKPHNEGYILKKKDVREFLGDYSDFL